MNMDQPEGRTTFSTPLGAVLATAGVAIGLGNIWRFPYMMGKYGGSAFLLLYVIIVLAFGIPALMAEYALGRHTRRGPLGAFRMARLPGAKFCGGLLLLTIFMAASYYGTILALALQRATSFTIAAAFPGQAGSTVAVSDGFAVQMLFVLITVALACAVAWLGVRRGIERASRYGLPLFFLLFVALIVRVLTLDGALEGLREFLVPQPKNFTGATVLAAMGQAFFSLSLGGTFMVVYGSYMRANDSIPAVAIGTTIADLSAASMAGLIIVPAVLALGMDMARGPALLFSVMPEVFATMPMGSVFGAAFFFAVFLVGLLSLIAAYEVLASAAEHWLGWSRARTVAVLLVVQVPLSIPAVLSDSYIGYSDLIWGTTMQPLGSGLAIVALIWCIGRAKAMQEIARASRLPMPTLLFYWLKYVIPAGVVVTLAYGWISQLRSS